MKAIEAKRYVTLALLAVLLLIAILSLLKASLWGVLFSLLLALLVYVGYIGELGQVLGEEGARSLGLIFSPKPELPAVPLLPGGGSQSLRRVSRRDPGSPLPPL